MCVWGGGGDNISLPCNKAISGHSLAESRGGWSWLRGSAVTLDNIAARDSIRASRDDLLINPGRCLIVLSPLKAEGEECPGSIFISCRVFARSLLNRRQLVALMAATTRGGEGVRRPLPRHRTSPSISRISSVCH